jgi:hypothetical protein
LTSFQSLCQKFGLLFTGADLLAMRAGCWACADALAVEVVEAAVDVGEGVGVVVVDVGVGLDVVELEPAEGELEPVELVVEPDGVTVPCGVSGN